MVRTRQQFRKRKLTRNNLRNKEQPDALSFSDQYHKARRNLVLFSAILFALTYAGFKLTKTGEEYQKQIPNTDMFVSLDNPNIIQIILFIVVLYFGYRLILEWNFCSSKKQITIPARIDFFGTLFIGYFSIIAYFAQGIFDTKLTSSFYIVLISTTLLTIYISLFVTYSFAIVSSKGLIKILNRIKQIEIIDKIGLCFITTASLFIIIITILISPIPLLTVLYFLTISCITAVLLYRTKIFRESLTRKDFLMSFNKILEKYISYGLSMLLFVILILLIFVLLPDLFWTNNKPPAPLGHPS